jgi:hypothetical protein
MLSAPPARAVPNLPSRDLAATARVYAAPGFRERFRDAGWLILQRGSLVLEFFSHPDLDPYASYAGSCLRVTDARALHAAFAAAGLPDDPRSVPRLTPPVAARSGFLQFALVDADGSLVRGLEPFARV